MCISVVSELKTITVDSAELYKEYEHILEVAKQKGVKSKDTYGGIDGFEDDIQQVTRILEDSNYKPWVPLDNIPHTLQLINDIQQVHNNITQVNYRRMKPSSNYTEHIDQGRFGPMTFHVPIMTNPSCYFCYPKNEQQMYHLELDKVYMCAVNKPHTFMNAGLEDRVHIHLHGDDTKRV